MIKAANLVYMLIICKGTLILDYSYVVDQINKVNVFY